MTVTHGLPPGRNAWLPPEALWVHTDEYPDEPEKIYYALHAVGAYPDDPGNGIEIWASGGRVYLSLFWDGAARDVWKLVTP